MIKIELGWDRLLIINDMQAVESETAAAATTRAIPRAERLSKRETRDDRRETRLGK